LQDKGYHELRKSMIERGVGPFQLEKTYSSKMNLSNIQNLEHKYKATKTQLPKKTNMA
jgi:hypothetical protein